MKATIWQRALSMMLCAAMLLAYLPGGIVRTEAATTSAYTTVVDPETLTRPGTIYGDSTVNTGKVTVGKSVSDTDITVNGKTIALDGENNFLVTISQSAQVMGLATEASVPVDVVFVLDTSGSMEDNNRASTMVTAANSAIATLMSANEQNRVAVVAFSSAGYGGGTSGGAAANVLSSLAHYTGAAATSHLQWVNSSGSTTGNNRQYIAGRDLVTVSTYNGTRTVNAYRNGLYGGTNIQAGIIEGGKILNSVTDTTYTDPVTGRTVNRIPFLIVLSDGQPTFTYDDETWYDPDSADQQGPGSGAYEGNGFIAAMTAAYYKGLITEHYYGNKAGGDNHCYVYTMGVELDSLTGDEKTLAQITLDPATYTAGDHAADGAGSYYNYGNTANDDNNKNAYFGWKSYWNNYQSGDDFTVRVDSSNDGVYVWTGSGTPESYYEVSRPREPSRWASQTEWNQYYADLQVYNDWLEWRAANFTLVTMYTFTAQSIAASKKYVSSIAYNDGYFSASSVSQMQQVFQQMVTTIQQKAISAPTRVTSGDHNFDGYVTFSDPLGEYMEVKDMKGVLAGGYFYQGASFAQRMSVYGKSNNDAAFDALMHKVIKTRMGLSESDSRFASEAELDAFIDNLLISARNSSNQANYTDNTNFDNSFVWWGNAYDSGEEDEHVQLVGFADNDTIAYITDPNTVIPAGADYVCRSYFFYGEAGGANPNPDHEYLYFVVRVQRELVAPYREAVVISAPASLLSMEKVLITESTDDEGNLTYTASVEHQEPARVVYEVGLWDTITPENVDYVVSSDYAGETVNGGGSVNYDAATGTYNFFTNDWDRSQTLASHHRALAKATFDAAADNPFYTYQQDTLILDANGNAVTANPAGTTAYYVREHYEWSDGNVDGTYAATKKSVMVEMDIPADAALIQKDGKWYVPKGTYTAATLVVNGDDTVKASNDTGTSVVVAHPHRTGDASNSHYTVFLGNNGMLSLVADPYEPVKTVSVNQPAGALIIVDGEGKPVQVGDVLTYTVEVKNVMGETSDITVTDYVPAGTSFVAGSAGAGTSATGHTPMASVVPDSNSMLTWVLEDVPAGETRYVSFQAKVEKSALSLTAVPGAIVNTAQVRIDNYPAVQTNPTHNTPYGKTVTAVNGTDIDGNGGYKVGDTLVYHIRFSNTATDANGTPVAADVTVTDAIPEGTAYVEGSADNGGTYANGVLTWQFDDMAAGQTKVVSFRVIITADAKQSATGTQPETGEVAIENEAVIVVENQPTITTNTTVNQVAVGDMVITKTVADGGDQSKAFTIYLTESTGLLDGTYVLDRDGTAESVTFTAGEASVTIKHGQKLTVKGLPAGTILSVAEDVSALPGWVPTYNTQSVTVTQGAATAVSSVSVTNTYHLQPTALIITADKALAGRTLAAGEFSFQLTDGTNTYYGINDAQGNIVFESITYTAAGTHSYRLSEIIPIPKAQGMTYDTDTHRVVVTVSDQNAQLVAQVTVDDVDKTVTNGIVDTGIVFDNTFTPDDVPLSVVAKKTLQVYDAATDSYVAAAPEAGKYRFQIKDAAGNTVAIGSNDNSGNITFETVYFSTQMLEGSNAKDFTYTVSEVVPELAKDPNMLYDTRQLPFTVTLTRDAVSGALTVSVNGDSDGNVDLTATHDFVNYSNPASVSVKPAGSKTTVGSNLPGGLSFSFEVQPVSGGADAAIGTSDATVGGQNSETTPITFGKLSYTHENLGDAATAVFDYWIMEGNSGAGDNGVTYDTTRYLYRVTLSRNQYGRLVATEQYFALRDGGNKETAADYTVEVTAAQVTFTNTYAAQTRVNLTAQKVLSGRISDLAAGEFEFMLQRLDTNGRIVSGSHITGTNNAEGLIRFATMNYSNAMLSDAYKHTDGSYYFSYLLSEIQPQQTAIPGVTYDNAKYVMTVKVTQDVSGMRAELAGVSKAAQTGDTYAPGEAVTGFTADGSTNITFTNTYQAVQGDVVSYRIRKDLQGRDVRAGEFEFGLYLNGKLEDVATNDENGIVTFYRTIPATAAAYADTYEMVIREMTGNIPGVTYSTQSYTIYVKVADNGRGKIEATVHLTADGPALAEDANGVVDLTDQFVFTNTYEAHDTTYAPTASKTLTGRAQVAGEFSFQAQLIQKDGAAVQNGASYKGVNDAKGQVLFETITFTDAGTYVYKLSELAGTVAGVKYDMDSSYYLKVVVTDDGNGHLKAETGYYTNEACTSPAANVVFVNTYTPAGVELPLTAYKTLTGKSMQAFTFQLTPAGGTPVTAQNDESGTVSFPNLKFTAADMVDGSGNKVMEKTFQYELVEVAGNMTGMNYDSTVYTVAVTVTDDGKGQLSAVAAYSVGTTPVDVIRFANTYTPPAIEVELEGVKVIKDAQGNTLTDAKYPLNGFEFEVYDAKGNFVTDAQSDATGKILFTDLSFSAAGEYHFTVREKEANKAGYTTDPTVWCVHIIIAYNRDTGVLYKADQHIHLAPESHDAAVSHASQTLEFVNVYDPADVTLVIKGMKVLNGRPLREQEFTFYMVDQATGLRASESRNHGNGEINFRLHYDKAGTYTYTVHEEIPAEPDKLGGVTYTDVTHVITVTVTDDGSGALKASVGNISVVNTGTADLTGTVVFTNYYTPRQTKAVVEAQKHLIGGQLTDKAFTFQLVNKLDANESYTATNDAGGKVQFEALTFTAADMVDDAGNKVMEKTFHYSLSEVKGSVPGVTYDEDVFTVSITVTDNGSGQLSSSVKYINYEGDVEAVPVFWNTYEAKSVGYVPAFKKLFEGSAMRTFDFVLSGEGYETQTKQNNDKGEITFDELTFEQAGTYVFTVSEQPNAAMEDVKWDSNVYTLTFEITDPGAGQLEIHKLTITSATGRNDLIFRNVHEDLITDKDVFVEGNATVSLDGEAVKRGDVLTYQVSYTNYTAAPVDVVITDKIPQYTAYVDGSADNGGVYADGVLTWNLEAVAPNNTVTVTFRVKVTGANVELSNKAQVLEGNNVYETNTVTNIVPEDVVVKDVFDAEEPTVSIDGKKVHKGDVLVYTITYTNSFEAEADVVITDKIPQHTTYVWNSADNGGVYAEGQVIWTLHLQAGQSVTVSFQVKVEQDDKTVTNQAIAKEGANEVKSNVTTTPVEKIPTTTPDTGDSTDLYGLVGTMAFSALGIVMMLAVLLLSRKKETSEQ